MERGVFRKRRNRLMYDAVSRNVGCLALGLSAWSSTSAATIVQSEQSWRTLSVKRAAARGSRDVPCVKWLISFHGEIVFTVGKACRKALIALSYSASFGSRQTSLRKLARRKHSEASPLECSKLTSTLTPCESA